MVLRRGCKERLFVGRVHSATKILSHFYEHKAKSQAETIPPLVLYLNTNANGLCQLLILNLIGSFLSQLQEKTNVLVLAA